MLGCASLTPTYVCSIPPSGKGSVIQVVPVEPVPGRLNSNGRFHYAMSTIEEFSAQLFRLGHVARSIAIKRALTATDPDPKLNFWRLIMGNQLDAAVLEWCKVFGSHGEATHWKNVVPPAEHDKYRADLWAELGVSADQWEAYWEEMKVYRDNLVAHHIEANKVPKYPQLDLALKSSVFHYKYVIAGLRSLGEHRYPDDLQSYYERLEYQSKEIAGAAMAATSGFQEKAY